ncbi:MAG: PilZ domain-containing protein [Desulfomonilaceae bacterium]
MEKKRQINGKNVLSDLRSGMADLQLRAKYKLSAKSLESIFDKLVKCGAVSLAELYERSSLYRECLNHVQARRHPRADLNVYVPVYDIADSAVGVLRDISENGLRLAGINAQVGQAKTFQVPVDMFMEAQPLLIIAECKWVQIKKKNRQYTVAGFELLDLPDADRQTLKDFIKLLLFKSPEKRQLVD